jgi:hypothetical protein
MALCRSCSDNEFPARSVLASRQREMLRAVPEFVFSDAVLFVLEIIAAVNDHVNDLTTRVSVLVNDLLVLECRHNAAIDARRLLA